MNSYIQENRKRLINLLSYVKADKNPKGWSHIASVAVGGLLSFGGSFSTMQKRSITAALYSQGVFVTQLMLISLLTILMCFGAALAEEPKSCLESAMTQMEMNKCAVVGYKEADAELNRVYKKIVAIYKDDKVFLEKFKIAQLAWIKLRDADFDLQYPHKNEPRYYGSVFPMCSADYKAWLTLQRVEFLKQWLIGVKEGNVCSGSKMKQLQLKEIL